MKKIQVLMSTYNGEKYLREQLDSILKQDCEELGLAELSILARDDGSSDSTQSILQEYSEKYADKVKWIQGKNCGVIKSFFHLLQQADESAEYYALSDQDDYWMPEKLSCGIRSIENPVSGKNAVLKVTVARKRTVPDIPMLYCCRPKLVDAELKELPVDIERPLVGLGFENALIENVVTGCTIVMNQALREIVVESLPDKAMMHDRWLYLVASCFGTVLYDEIPHICYRQHGGNVVGTSHNRFDELRERLKRFWGRRSSISNQAAEFVSRYEKLNTSRTNGYISDEYVQECLELAFALSDAKNSLKNRLQLVKGNRLFRQRKMDNRIFKLLIILGIY